MSLTTYESEMGTDGSGTEWATTTTNQTTTENHETTTFLPMTDNAAYISHDSNRTTTPRPTITTSSTAAPNATNFHPRDVTAPLSTAHPPLGGATTTASTPNMLIVGLGCSALGILIGIILTCVIWSMYRRHRRHRGIIDKHHSSAAIEKNPQERTFEPLDMSLTKSNYGVAVAPGSSTPGSTRVVQVERLEAMTSALAAAAGAEDVVIPDNHSGSYMRFEPPTPPQMPATIDEQGMSHMTDHHHVMSPPPISIPLHEMRHRHLLSNLSTFHGISVETDASGMDTKQQAYSNSLIQRDSFSSGRGTGTDSDTIPPPNSDPPQHHRYHNNHHRGKPQQQQQQQQQITQQKQRVANNSNASSTATSSGWSTTLPGDKDDDDSNEVLSSYFDMHFPNSNGGIDTPPAVDSRRMSSSSSTLHHQQRVIEETIDL